MVGLNLSSQEICKMLTIELYVFYNCSQIQGLVGREVEWELLTRTIQTSRDQTASVNHYWDLRDEVREREWGKMRFPNMLQVAGQLVLPDSCVAEKQRRDEPNWRLLSTRSQQSWQKWGWVLRWSFLWNTWMFGNNGINMVFWAPMYCPC